MNCSNMPYEQKGMYSIPQKTQNYVSMNQN